MMFAAIFLGATPDRCLAGTSAEDVQKYLAAEVRFDDADLLKLRNGEMVARLVPSDDKREVAVFGAIPIKTSLDLGLKTFQDTMARLNKKSIMESGSFSAAPTVEDLKDLTLEKGDLEDLKQCRVGNCRLQLSEAMIERFQKEIDWNAPDYAEQANRLFRQMMAEYVGDYLARGNAALIEYGDRQDAINLENEHRALLKDLLWLNESAPELSKYLADFPRSEPSNVRKSVNWTKVKFGLKPVIIITQTITYMAGGSGDDPSQILSVSKQLYASRYFDASLGLTALVKTSRPDAPSPEAYLLYTNQSRSSSLDGLLSKFKHGIVEREALKKLEPLLEDTKAYAEAKLTNRVESPELSTKEQIIEWLNKYKYLISIVLIGFLIAIFATSKQIMKPQPR